MNMGMEYGGFRMETFNQMQRKRSQGLFVFFSQVSDVFWPNLKAGYSQNNMARLSKTIGKGGTREAPGHGGALVRTKRA